MRLQVQIILTTLLFLVLMLFTSCAVLLGSEIEFVPTITIPDEPAITATPKKKPSTLIPTQTRVAPTVETPTREPDLTVTPIREEIVISQPAAQMPFRMQLGSPKYIPAFVHQNKECYWFGIAGQVFDENGAGSVGSVVMAAGSLAGQEIIRASLTFSDSEYGPGGYEIFLTNQPPDENSHIIVQLYTLESQPLSDPISIVLPNTCEQTLVLINFQSSDTVYQIHLPVVFKEPGSMH
jgi:hypothetical protein